MSAHLSVPRKDEYQINVSRWIPNKPTLVPSRARPVESKSHDWLLGMLGLVVVATIFGLSVYFIFRYLL